jgi:hypothetical protein
MTSKYVSSSEIYALQAVFTLAYVAGIALVCGFKCFYFDSNGSSLLTVS